MTKLKSDNKHAIQVTRRFVRAVQKAGIRLDAAYLYGSYAVGTARADSDIDIALVSEDFTGHFSSDWEKIKPALHSADSRIQHVRYPPNKFRDENPLVWEIKTTGIQLVGKPSQRAKRPLNIQTIVKYWRKSADNHWHAAQTFFKVKSYSYALQFARFSIEELLKAIIVRRTRQHAPFRLTLIEYAAIAELHLTSRQATVFNQLDTYDPRNLEDELAFHNKYTRRFCKSEFKKIRESGRWLASFLTT